MNRRPTWLQALDAQLAEYVWLGSRGAAELGTYEHNPDGGYFERTRAVPENLSYERGKLFRADPYFVTAEMCDVVDVAVRSYEPEPIEPTDFLTPCGFLLFERAIPLDIRQAPRPSSDPKGALPFAAFAWEWHAPNGSHVLDNVHISVYLDSELVPDASSRYPGQPSLLLWETLMLFTADPPDPDAHDLSRLVQSTLALMRDFRPASRYSSRERPDRASRKRAKRVGLPEREITVVRLRRDQKSSENTGTSIDYAFRFMVSGHWRNQWFPSLQTHRQTWIAPYVKGPDDKPFRPPQRRVFNLYR